MPAASALADKQNGQTLGRGMDYGIDRWLGTRPWFMIGLVIFAVIGQFIKMYYDYTAAMEAHEADRANASQAHRR